MTTMTESHRVRQIKSLLDERYRNTTFNRSYLLISEAAGVCSLEGIDRRVIEVSRNTLENSEVWERMR